MKNFMILALVLTIALGVADLIYGAVSNRGPLIARVLIEAKDIKNEQRIEDGTVTVSILGNKLKLTEVQSDVKVSSEEDVLNVMHKMANTKIIADQISGEIEITKDRVDYLLWYVARSNFKNKEKLLEILYRWREGKFDQADKEHNFLLKELGGTIGEAKGVKP